MRMGVLRLLADITALVMETECAKDSMTTASWIYLHQDKGIDGFLGRTIMGNFFAENCYKTGYIPANNVEH